MAAGVIIFFNWISKVILTRFAAYQKRETYSSQIYEETTSMAAVEVLNCGLVPLAIAAYASYFDGEDFMQNAYKKGGFVEEVSFVLVTMLLGDTVK